MHVVSVAGCAYGRQRQSPVDEILGQLFEVHSWIRAATAATRKKGNTNDEEAENGPHLSIVQ